MKGLLTKEFYMLITSSMVLFIPVFILLGLLTKNSFFLTYIGVLFALMPISLMTFDETSHWERYVLGLPFDRRRIVSSKYLMTLILTAGAAAIMLLMSYAFNKTGAISYDEALPVVGSSLLLCIIFPALLYPLNFKLGTAKARMVMLAAVGLLTAAFVVLSSSNQTIGSLIGKLDAASPAVVCGIIGAVLAIIFAASWVLSLKLYSSREF